MASGSGLSNPPSRWGPGEQENALELFNRWSAEEKFRKKEDGYRLVAEEFGKSWRTVERLMQQKMPTTPKKLGRKKHQPDSIDSVWRTPPTPKRRKLHTFTTSSSRAVLREAKQQGMSYSKVGTIGKVSKRTVSWIQYQLL